MGTRNAEAKADAALGLATPGADGGPARDLAYRLYGACERKEWSQERLAYNSLVIAWPEVTRLECAERPREDQARLGL